MAEDEIDAFLDEIVLDLRRQLRKKLGKEEKDIRALETSIRKLETTISSLRKELKREKEKEGHVDKAVKRSLKNLESSLNFMKKQLKREVEGEGDKEIKALIEKAIQRKASRIKERERGPKELVIKRG
ncbi:MAG: hypothetical protein QXU82_01785 [Candidatus Aenigmatarchaeota archaeon]